ncbi:MAG TPA: rod shape-determining protein [Anaerolineae bacterium]|nr:rod shape-determining protein [Anaerolineae bacterium]HMR63649.1 rod shape-determining protein [Anaerolineae bacterium]
MFAKKIGIDLGTYSILVYVKGRGIVLQEPSVVAISLKDERIVSIGQEALAMLGRVPDAIETVRPLRSGVIADYYVTEKMLDFYIERLVGRFRLFPPEVMISTPVGITSVERRAVEDAARKAARREAYTIPEPLAAAIGAGMPIDTPTGNMVLDVGGGTSEAAVIAMNGIVTSDSIRVAGMKLDEAIINYIRRKYNLVIGEHTAEEVKIKIGSALPLDEPLRMEVKGRDQVAGLPKSITINSDEVTEALSEPLLTIAGVVKSVLEKTPPELASDIIDRGIIMTGGTSQLRNLDTMLTQEIGVPCYVADNPEACVALGAGWGLEMREALERATLPAYY